MRLGATDQNLKEFSAALSDYSKFGTLSVGLRICWLDPLQRSNAPTPTKKCPVNVTKLYLMVKVKLWDVGSNLSI